jgi:hypothetical protein
MTKRRKIGIVVLAGIVLLSGLFLLQRPPQSPSFETKGTVYRDRDLARAQQLEGKWIRLDGGYTLVIDDVESDGTATAAYYNPRNIHVSEARWEMEKDRLNLFVELKDTHYPGSTYSLVYADDKDVLHGYYFQAVQQQNYEIRFVRMLQSTCK